MTACVTESPRYASASRFNFISVRALISCGVYFFPSMSSDFQFFAHVSLDAAERAVGVGDRLTLGDFANEHFTGLGKRNNGGRGAGSFGVRDDDWFASLKDGDDRVRGSESIPTAFAMGCSFGGGSLGAPR